MKVSEIATRVRYVLQDAGADYWSNSEINDWIADARLDAYKLRPDIYEHTEVMSLVAGTRQTLPGGSRWLFEVIRNDSSPTKRHVTLVSARDLARVRPNWRSLPGANEIEHFLYDPRDPGHFEVYPPAGTGLKVLLSYAKLPVTSIRAGDNLQPEGEYATAFIEYVLYRAFSKEADTVPAFHARAMQHLQMFRQILGDSVQARLATGPDVTT
ncbi:DUF6682 family protein [Allopusillimonas ginsengisoli]|uniref:phage adaptor protein n=1 Tax=Allopusillimonas ginsengisoli TaxID=453575 RepID=UPI0039C396CA